MDHVVSRARRALRIVSEASARLGARRSPSTSLEPGQRLQLVKFVAYGWSTSGRVPAMRDQVAAALLAARTAGWERLVAEQRAYLDDFWATADVEARGRRRAATGGALRAVPVALRRRARGREGDPRQGADRHRLRRPFVLGHRLLRHAGARVHGSRRRRGCAALAPLDPRRRRRSAPRHFGLAGAAFPWRTIHGEECSGYWPAGTAAFHVNADIASAVILVRSRDRRPSLRARHRPRDPRRDGAAVALARPLRSRAAAFASTA